MKRILLLLLVASIITSSCSGMRHRADTASEELDRAASLVNEERGNVFSLNEEEYPGNGFFYILNSQGIVLMHPKAALTGEDFSRYDFMRDILEKERGCVTFASGTRTISIFFTRLNNGDILCFTLESTVADGTYGVCP